MKRKISMKEIKKGYKNIVCVGYCDLWCLLSSKEPKYYTAGVYGWNADVYEINNNTCIVTGYRPFGNIEIDYNIVKEYNKKAESIYKDHNLDYTEIQKKINILLDNFIEKEV